MNFDAGGLGANLNTGLMHILRGVLEAAIRLSSQFGFMTTRQHPSGAVRRAIAQAGTSSVGGKGGTRPP